MARPGYKLTISRSEVNCANHYSTDPLLENQQIVTHRFFLGIQLFCLYSELAEIL